MTRSGIRRSVIISLNLLAFGLLGVSECRAQESVRMSLAGAEAAEARRKAASSLSEPNLRLGPTAWNFKAGLGVDANDNIQLEPVDPKSDIILRPELSTRMILPLSQVNSLNLAMSAGYSAAATRWFASSCSSTDTSMACRSTSIP